MGESPVFQWKPLESGPVACVINARASTARETNLLLRPVPLLPGVTIAALLARRRRYFYTNKIHKLHKRRRGRRFANEASSSVVRPSFQQRWFVIYLTALLCKIPEEAASKQAPSLAASPSPSLGMINNAHTKLLPLAVLDVYV